MEHLILFAVLSVLIILIFLISKKLKNKKVKVIFKIVNYLFFIVWLYAGIGLGITYLNPEYIANLNDSINTLNNDISEQNELLNTYTAKIASSSEEEKLSYNTIDELNNSYNELLTYSLSNEELLSSLESEYKQLQKQYDELYEATSFKIDKEITYNQYPNYPNGCESVALYILLKYYDIDVTVEEIVEILPKGSSPYYVNGVRYGGNPEREFVGDPRLYSGYGCFQKPIITVANEFKEGIIDYTGASLDEVLEIVKQGIPVQAWVSINIKDTKVTATWLDEQTGKKINWLGHLHSLVIIGYDYKTIIVSDPYTGKIEYYDRTQFEKMYNLFGKRALYYES